jgi:hypothetical protein
MALVIPRYLQFRVVFESVAPSGCKPLAIPFDPEARPRRVLETRSMALQTPSPTLTLSNRVVDLEDESEARRARYYDLVDALEPLFYCATGGPLAGAADVLEAVRKKVLEACDFQRRLENQAETIDALRGEKATVEAELEVAKDAAGRYAADARTLAAGLRESEAERARIPTYYPDELGISSSHRGRRVAAIVDKARNRAPVVSNGQPERYLAGWIVNLEDERDGRRGPSGSSSNRSTLRGRVAKLEDRVETRNRRIAALRRELDEAIAELRRHGEVNGGLLTPPGTADRLMAAAERVRADRDVHERRAALAFFLYGHLRDHLFATGMSDGERAYLERRLKATVAEHVEKPRAGGHFQFGFAGVEFSDEELGRLCREIAVRVLP